MLRIFFIVLGVIAMIGWALWYIWVFGMACAFGSVNTTHCRVRPPWELNGEDLMMLVVWPGALVAVLFFCAWLAGRNRKETSHKNDI